MAISNEKTERVVKLVRECQLKDEAEAMPTDELVSTLEIFLAELQKRNNENLQTTVTEHSEKVPEENVHWASERGDQHDE